MRIIVLVLLLVSACRQKSPEEKLRDFVEDPDNKITQRIKVGDVGIVTRFLPVSYRLLNSKEKDSVLSND